MDYKSTLTDLFFLLIYADEKLSDNEVVRGKQMMIAEGINETKFNLRIEELKRKSKDSIYKDCAIGLKKLTKELQIKAIAWLCVVANADGFMDKNEWMLIYKIYHTELNLKLDEIMKIQRELNKVVHGKEFTSFGVWMNREAQSSK